MRKINELKDKTIMDRFSLYFCFKYKYIVI